MEGTLGFFKDVWRYKVRAILTGCVVFTLCFFYVLSQDPIYEASMIIAPTDDDGQVSSLGLSKSVSQVIGLGGAGSQNQKTSEFLSLLSSYQVAEQMQREYKLLQRLYPKLWVEEKQRWAARSGGLVPLRNFFRSITGRPPVGAPTIHDLHDLLGLVVKIEEIPEFGHYKIAAQLDDPDLALFILENIHRETDALIRKTSIEKSEERRTYVLDQLETVQNSAHRDALVSILAETEQLSMMANMTALYSINVLQQPVVSPTPVRPAYAALLVLSVFFAAAAALAVIIGSGFFDSYRAHAK